MRGAWELGHENMGITGSEVSEAESVNEAKRNEH